jgi:hypothetical protein
VREGAALIKECKARLAEIKNEFEEIQRDVESSGLAEASSLKERKSTVAVEEVKEE